MGKIKPVSKKISAFFTNGRKRWQKNPQQAAQPDGLQMISAKTLAFPKL